MISNKALLSVLSIAATLTAHAQTSSNSPYTRYGLGDLSDQVFTNNAAMGGIGYALRAKDQINPMNPASYSAVDSLSFMFDVGMSLRNSNYKEGSVQNNVKNASFDYIAMQFRLHPRLGMAVGFTPFSTTGYNFSKTTNIENSDKTATNSFAGEGGLQQIFGGLSFKVFDNLSIGANIGYLYGSLKYGTTISGVGDIRTDYLNIDAKSYKADFGVQYTQPLNKKSSLTLGLTYGLGHTLNSTTEEGTQMIKTSSSSSTTTTSVDATANDAYSIPHSFGAGLVWKYNNQWTAGIDYSLQKWSKATYYKTAGQGYKDRSKVAAGIEYLPNSVGRSYLSRIRYRAGAYYNTSYFKTPEGDGPNEYGVSAGFGLPLNLFQRNSILNITGQYIHSSASNSRLLSENRFVIKLGLTFNERWFMKFRVQ